MNAPQKGLGASPLTAEPGLYGGSAGVPAKDRKPMTLHRLREMHTLGEPITMLTCYDASFARVLDGAGVDCLLIGDSLGMVLQGESSTLPVTVEQIAYHVRSVVRGNRSAWVIGDLPFGSYQESPSQAMRSATALMQAGAHMVKLEGGGWTAETTRFLVERGVPVCAHLGLTPQSVHALGGYRIQGRNDGSAATLKQHARELADAGAAMVVLELMPSAVGAEITKAIPIPTIGIGAGVGCSGQVLVLHDMLGVTSGKLPRFVRNFLQGAASVDEAITRYVAAVKTRQFPDENLHGYA
jgi:3-methyl-2-oxobutanoate hydroxymethyltransferase